MLAAIAPSAFARANRRAATERVEAASHTRADVIAYASTVSGNSHASRSGQPAINAIPRNPEKLATAADAAAITIPATTHQSRPAPTRRGAAASGKAITSGPVTTGHRSETCGDTNGQCADTYGTAWRPGRPVRRTDRNARTSYEEASASGSPPRPVAVRLV